MDPRPPERFVGPWLPRAGIVAAATLTAAYWAAYTFDVASGESKLFNWSGYVIVGLAVWWVAEDARATRYWPFLDYGIVVYFGWPLAISHYLVRTRRWRGLLLVVPLVACVTAATWGWCLGVLLGVALGAWSREEAWLALAQLWNPPTP